MTTIVTLWPRNDNVMRVFAGVILEGDDHCRSMANAQYLWPICDGASGAFL